jgi:hypothetical protein
MPTRTPRRQRLTCRSSVAWYVAKEKNFLHRLFFCHPERRLRSLVYSDPHKVSNLLHCPRLVGRGIFGLGLGESFRENTLCKLHRLTTSLASQMEAGICTEERDSSCCVMRRSICWPDTGGAPPALQTPPHKVLWLLNIDGTTGSIGLYFAFQSQGSRNRPLAISVSHRRLQNKSPPAAAFFATRRHALASRTCRSMSPVRMTLRSRLVPGFESNNILGDF